MKKLNLLICIAGLHHGGAERVVATLCKSLNPNKFNITVLWRIGRGDIGEELLRQGYDVIGTTEINPDVSPYKRFLLVNRLIRDRHIDVVHTHDTGALLDAAQCKMVGTSFKLVHTYHFGNYPNLHKSHLLMELLASRFADRLIAVGYEQAKKIRKSLFINRKKLDVVYNGVILPVLREDLNLVSEFRTESNSVVIGSISTLTAQKGIANLLDSVAILKKKKKNCIFLIVGDGPLAGELHAKCRHLKLEDMVHFLGWVEAASDKVLLFLDIFCQSSLWEANSIVLLEAMACGLPIVTTDVGESGHVLENGKNGIIVDTGSAQEIADALEQLIDNKSFREEMGRVAKEKFIKNYTQDKMIANYEYIYQSLI